MKNVWLVLLLLTASVGMAQDCDQTVTDDGSAFSGHQTDILLASQELSAVGADVRVRSFPSSSNLDLTLDQMMKRCPSWQAPDGNWKSTIIVLALAMNHKKGIHYGSSWHKALDGQWERILEESMVPRFRSGDFSGGMIAAQKQLAARIKESQSEAIHPVVATTVQQATDYSGFWQFLKLSLLAISFGLFTGFLWVTYRRRRKEREEVAEEQQRAILARNNASSALLDARRDLEKYKDSVGVTIAQSAYDSQSEAYSKLSSQIRTDPTQDGLSASEYKLIGGQYDSVTKRLNAGMEFVRRPIRKWKADAEPFPPQQTTKEEVKREEPERKEVIKTEEPERKEEPERRESNTIFAPVVIGNSFGSRERERDDDDRETRRSRSRDDDSSSSSGGGWGSSGSSDSGSGGSSSWSGGSDFGGGGSSDFGGGGDSGGGGSSGW